MQPTLPGRTPPRIAEGRFSITDTLGEGGAATVYLCWDHHEHQWCALKVVRRVALHDADMARRFEQEAEALSRLSHPNIPRLVCYGGDCTPPYLVMELARAGSVMDWIDVHGPMAPPLAVDVLAQICDALGEAHRVGIIHRDVKPHNFLIDEEGVCKLTDFGIARVEAMTATGTQIGSFSFMAPEQRVDTKRADHRADVYSLGASLFTMLTGRTSAELFVAESDDALLADVPAAFRAVIMGAAQYGPEDRYASVAQFKDALMDAVPTATRSAGAGLATLVAELEPLAAGPPETLPPGRRFPELAALAGSTPRPAPRMQRSGNDAPATQDSEPVRRTPDAAWLGALGYRMPERPAPRFAEGPSETGSFDAVPTVEPVSQTPMNPGIPILGLGSALVGACLLVLLAGAGWVWWMQTTHATAARTFRAVTLDNEGVIHEIGGASSTLEAAYEAFENAEGSGQLAAASSFVDELQAVAQDTPRLGPTTQRRLARLRDARDAYWAALHGWDHAARTFPGSLSVWTLLARPPGSQEGTTTEAMP